ncbi:adenosine/AMP deaminase [Leptolyngbya sp. NIES-3755]|nr:adenosine/AMP deaminase [Leptolyngbya sp. NIES-3755]
MLLSAPIKLKKQACQDAAFRHAFVWNYAQRPASLLDRLLKSEAS